MGLERHHGQALGKLCQLSADCCKKKNVDVSFNQGPAKVKPQRVMSTAVSTLRHSEPDAPLRTGPSAFI